MKTIFQGKGFRITFFLISLSIFAFIGNDSKASFSCGTSTVTDVDSKVYNTVSIGTQCWMRENMMTTKYPDGSNITRGPVGATWDGTDHGYYAYPPNTANTAEESLANIQSGKLGFLYQWSAAMHGSITQGAQGICPTGWHIPTDTEYKTLEMQLGLTQVQADATGWRGTDQGTQMKTVSATTFSGLIAGLRYTDGSFVNRSTYSRFWSSSAVDASDAWYRYLHSGFATVARFDNDKAYGFSVRCVQDPSVTSPTLTTGSASSVTSTTATLGGSVTDTGGENPTRYIQWGTSTGSYSSSCDQSTGTTGTYSCNLTSLTPNITYYYRAYATNSGGTAYGSEQTFTTPISLTGVSSGETYFSQVTPVFSGTALLNGSSFTSGTSITQNGSYTLYIVGSTNTITATFTLIISKTITNPTPAIINNDVTSGIITVSGTSTEATNATIKTNYTLQSGNSLLSIPKDTIITPATGTVDITALNVSDISNTISQQNSNSKGAIKIGIPNKSVNFSQDVTVAMSVGSSYDGKTLTIYSRPDSGGDWTYHGSCLVSNSQCTFTTTHATEYTGNYEVSNSPTPTDTNLDINATISISCDDTVTMATITGTGYSGSVTGPGATNEADCNIKTINSAGYQLAWQASTSYMENTNGDRIGAYTPATSDTPEVWSVEASMSEWGARVKSSSTDPDLTAGAIWGITGDTYGGRFLNVGTSSFTVANRATETDQTGSNETILFGAEIGSNKFQPTGTYTTSVTMTATTL